MASKSIATPDMKPSNSGLKGPLGVGLVGYPKSVQGPVQGSATGLQRQHDGAGQSSCLAHFCLLN